MSTLISLVCLFIIYILLFAAVLYRHRAMAGETATLSILQFVSFIVCCAMLVHFATELVHCYVRGLEVGSEAGSMVVLPSPTDHVIHALLECVVLNALAWRCFVVWGSPDLLKTSLASVVVTTSVTRLSFAAAPSPSSDCVDLSHCVPTDTTSPLLKFILPRWTFILHTLLSLAVLVGCIRVVRSQPNAFTSRMPTQMANTEELNRSKIYTSALHGNGTPLCAPGAHLIAKAVVDSFILGWIPFAILLLGETDVLTQPQSKTLVHNVGSPLPLLFAISYTLMLYMLEVDFRSHRPEFDSEAQYELLPVAAEPDSDSENLETGAETGSDTPTISAPVIST